MSQREQAALTLQELATIMARSRGVVTDHGDGSRSLVYSDGRLRISYMPPIRGSSNPAVLDVWKIGEAHACVLTTVGDFVVTYRPGSWENSLRIAVAAAAAV
jgi:hypothetical protein